MSSSQPIQARQDASSFRALVLIGVAAAFCAASNPHMTRLSAASKLGEPSHPVAFPPQWLPVFLASSSRHDDSPAPRFDDKDLPSEGEDETLPPPIPPPSLPPPPSPPPECAGVQLKTTGWQMLSFNCIGGLSNTFDVLKTAPWKVDDRITTRDPEYKFAAYNGNKWQGGLDQLSMSLGYKILYSGAPGAVLEQTGLPQFPVEDVVLRAGWNWIGHAPLHSYSIDSITAVGAGQFNADDQIKTRVGSVLKYTTGTDWEGAKPQLTPGIGYEVRVSQAATFRYGALGATVGRRMLAKVGSQE